MPRFAKTGFVRTELWLPIRLALTTGAEVRVAEALGYRAELVSATSFVQTAGAGAGATRALTIGKGTSLTSITTMTHTLAGTATLGAEVAGTLAAGDARLFEDADLLNIGFASGGTVFTAGEIMLRLVFLQRPQTR
jgi:hypothetical protein